VRVDGTGDETFFFVHGWPDDESLWDAQVAHFKDRYRCVRVTMPHFAGRSQAKELGHDQKLWGYDFSEAGDILAATMRREAKEAVAHGHEGAMTLVLHDWGVFWGLIAQRRCPELVKAVVVMDVGPPSSFASGWYTLPRVVFAGLAYQYLLFGAYALARSTHGSALEGVCRPIADAMVRAVAGMVVPSAGPAQGPRVTADACYPYYYMQTDWGVRGIMHDNSEPKCRCLFLYGTRKPFMFHISSWVRQLAARPDCHVVQVPAGHWIQVQRPDIVNAAMESWLAGADSLGISKL
jgi:pimeloyl-ACP methyl ester carboxylesterase